MGVAQKSASTVLVVEDEPLTRMHAAIGLADGGFDVLEAASADEALTILKGGPPVDVLFTDVQMPGSHDGISLARVTFTRWPHIGVLITSGLFQPVIPAPARFIEKPYELPEIILEVELLLGAFRI
jgi:CheY-like chemotaxis protein